VIDDHPLRIMLGDLATLTDTLDATCADHSSAVAPRVRRAVNMSRNALRRVTAISLVTTLAVTVLVARSRLGVAFRCIRQNEEAANMIGIDATRAKIIAFALSAAFPGAAGALYASWVGYIDPSDVFDILNSVKAPVMVLLGGVGTVAGPAIGALLYLVFEEIVWRSLLQFHAAVLGLIIVLLVLFLPSGFVDVVRRRKFLRGAP